MSIGNETNKTTSSILRAEKMPYFLVILFAILTYALTHIVDRLSNIPLVRYRVERTKSKRGWKFTYHIKNITADKNFKNIDFLVLPAIENDTISFFRPWVYAPTRLTSPGEAPVQTSEKASFHLDNLQPSATLDLLVEKSKPQIIELKVSSESTLVLSTQTYKTFLLENEVFILIILTFISLGLIIFYIYKIK